MGKEINKTKPSSLKATLALTYNQGASQFSKEAKETKTYEKYKEFKEFRKIIDREAKKRNAKPYELIDYFAEHKEELLNLLKKKDSTSQKFSKIKFKENFFWDCNFV